MAALGAGALTIGGGLVGAGAGASYASLSGGDVGSYATTGADVGSLIGGFGAAGAKLAGRVAGFAANAFMSLPMAGRVAVAVGGTLTLPEVTEAGRLKLIQATANALLRAAKPVGRAIRLSVPSASQGRSYVTYVFRNARREITYIGKASGKGLPEQVMRTRIRRGHAHFRQGLTPEVYSVHRSPAAMRGAEYYYWRTLRGAGVKLTNVNSPIDFDHLDRAQRGLRYLQRFIAG